MLCDVCFVWLQILDQTHSRIPVYEGNRENIVAMRIVKTLIKHDPEDCTSIRSLVNDGFAKPVLRTEEDKPLFDLLNEFQGGKGVCLLTMFSDR